MGILKGFSLLLQILLCPSQWVRALAVIDPALAPEFSLIELQPRHWQDQRLRQRLVQGYLLAPLTLWGLLLALLLLLGQPLTGTLLAFVCAALVAVGYGLLVCAAAGMTILAIVGTVAGVLWVSDTLVLLDMILSTRYALLFGLAGALTIVVVNNLSQRQNRETRWRQIGGVVLGFVATLLVMAVAVAFLSGLITGRQAGYLPGTPIGWLAALLPAFALGVASWMLTRHWQKAGWVATVVAVLIATAFGDIGYEFSHQIGGVAQLAGIGAITLGMFFVFTILPYVMVRRFVGSWHGAVSAAIGGLAIYPTAEAIYNIYALRENLVLAIGLLVAGLAFGWLWSAIAYLFEAGWNTLLYQLEWRAATRAHQSVRWLPSHAVFWDEIQRLPFYELPDFLVLANERDGQQGAQWLQRVEQSRQQWAAQAARSELDARHLEKLDTVAALAEIRRESTAGLLATPAGLMVRNFAQLGGDVAAALAQPSPYNQRLVLSNVAHDLESLQSELARNGNDPLARRYRSVARRWHEVIIAHITQLDQEAIANQAIPNPYIVGVPLTRRQEIFVGRTDIARYVEDILRQGDHPPILLYGPRRMGKTSLLYQLNWMLPRRILPLVVDLQGPVSLASNNVGFLHALARGIRLAAARNEITLPDLPRAALEQEPFTVFDEWLTQIGAVIANDQREAILFALDEFEALDAAFVAGTLEERAILGMLRHIIQHRRGVKLLLSGSHTLEEFRRWSSYLINAQVVELGYLEEGEARRLIETPIPDFPLRYEPAAVQQVLALTRGHPYLVQLLCMEVVALKNRQPPVQRQLVIVTDVEAATPAMLERGQQFFADIELNQIDADGRTALIWLAHQGAGYEATAGEFSAVLPAATIAETLQWLVQRSLLEERAGRVWFAVEVVRRWFAAYKGASSGP